jgi:IS66 C-terminal element
MPSVMNLYFLPDMGRNLFAGHDQGAVNWACIASLIETAKLHGIDPKPYLADVLTKTRQWLADGEDRRIIALGMGPTKQSQPGGITTSSISSAAAPRKPPAPRSRRHRPPRGSRAASLDEDRLDLLSHRL